jgi:Pao retrotransposon peptidase./Putative peptidase (DUF1758)./Integrase core domain./Protein of unknown function (DUF1759).
VIENFQLTADNYQLAYQALVTRYQNTRRIAVTYLNKILDHKFSNIPSLSGLKTFVQIHQNSIQAIKALNIGDLANFLLVSLALRNLDSRTARAFEEKQTNAAIPSFDDLLEFVEHQIKILEMSSTLNPASNSAPRNKSSSAANPKLALITANQEKRSPSQVFSKCLLCHKGHSLSMCPNFSHLKMDEKIQFVRRHRRCFNCLGSHLKVDCPSTASCRKCSSKSHHTLLHPGNQIDSTLPPKPNAVASAQTENADSTPPNAPVSCISSSSRTAPASVVNMLGTFRARILHSSLGYVPVRGVIDPGSQISFISQRLARTLNLKIKRAPMTVSGIGGLVSTSSGTVSCNIVSSYSTRHVIASLSVIPNIVGQLPNAELPPTIPDTFIHLQLADPDFHRPDRIELLLGADIYPQLLSSEPIVKQPNGPVAISTIFGWTIIGPLNSQSPIKEITSLVSTAEISRQLEKFWEIEHVNAPTIEDPLDALAEQHFRDTHVRQPDGRYSVSLPMKPGATPLQDNASRSYASLINLQKRLAKTPKLASEYQEFMTEYSQLKHMAKATVPSSYVIPHHVVTKITNQGSKIRVVFNASSPDSSGVSLNERLLKGPKLQADVSVVLLNFRLAKVALCCDIQKMYRQVLVHDKDRHLQHIYWTPDGTSRIEEAQLNTVTYGLAPSAFLAMRVLHQLVIDEGAAFPLASVALKTQTYVDDIITGADDIESANHLRSQLAKLLSLGGFELRKWSTSHPQVLQGLPEEHCESSLLLNDEDKSLKILGLNWEPSKDQFTYRVIPFEAKCTKRNMLSFLARIFDPNGYLSPVTVCFKIIIQKLWTIKLDWDQNVPSLIEGQWAELLQHLPLVSTLSFPRCVIPSHYHSIRLVGFADASESAYAAALYICFESDQARSSFLWKAKTRVAPLKTLSIPRLELCACVLLTDLLNSVIDVRYPVNVSEHQLFTDSEIVLAWLRTPPHLLKTFVANRVVHINSAIPSNTVWSHISSALNPADMASRGLNPALLSEPTTLSLWSHGPSFMYDAQVCWPPSFSSPSAPSMPIPELKSTPVALIASDSVPVDPSIVCRFSSFLRLQRVVAWMMRFARNCRSRLKAQTIAHGPLTASELEQSLLCIVSIVQASHFAEQILLIKSDKHVPSLSTLSPFLDEVGILRVGGRLQNSELSFSAQHPMLIPRNSHLATLICSHYHLASMHAGPLTCQALIRERFWILSLRRILRTTIHRCAICHRSRAATLQPPMSSLPSFRVRPVRPFTTTGVDFAGPFNVRVPRLRKPLISKGYLCLFVCASTKAVHLEFASELSTSSFLAAFDRFIARRGLPRTMLSDQGRNFVGAETQLSEIYDLLLKDQQEFCDHLSRRQITWQFNPPYAPNFGGLWEAAVKSTKALLYRMSKNILFTTEEYFTLFARIESILNSRPLCGLSSAPEESMNYLSPGHFLIGAPLLARPELEIQEDVSLHDRWKKISQMVQSFWNRWSREYLNTLNQRLKWNRPSKELTVGDVVIVKNLNYPPPQWPLARVHALHPGADGHTRVVTLRTADGIITRPVNRVIPMPE